MIYWLLLLALQFNPDFSPKFQQASKLMRENKFAEAIALLEELHREKPASTEYNFALGLAHAASDNKMKAMPYLDTACRAKPSTTRACLYYGRLLQTLGRHKEAVEAFETVPQVGQSSDYFTDLALSHERLSNFRAADSAYRAALSESALRPANSAEVQLLYARFLLRQGRWESALWQLNQSLRKKPFNGQTWREKATALIQLDRKEEAADSLEQALTHGERTKENLLLLSKLFQALGHKDKAEEYRKEAQPN
jgi:protein O-GlcNAc transferase